MQHHSVEQVLCHFQYCFCNRTNTTSVSIKTLIHFQCFYFYFMWTIVKLSWSCPSLNSLNHSRPGWVINIHHHTWTFFNKKLDSYYCHFIHIHRVQNNYSCHILINQICKSFLINTTQSSFFYCLHLRKTNPAASYLVWEPCVFSNPFDLFWNILKNLILFTVSFLTLIGSEV